MKINVISFSLFKGGAAIAACKFYDLLIKNNYCAVQITQDNSGYCQFLLRLLSYTLGFLQKKEEPIKHSLNLFSYRTVLNAFRQPDAVNHVHWINNDTLSVFSLNKIPQNSLITLHDEWLYCATEHYCNFIPLAEDEQQDLRVLPFINGYCSKIIGHDGLNWKYIIWQQKLNKLSARNDLVYTVPSKWMLERASASQVLRGKDIRLLPNPIDVDIFSATNNRIELRERFGFSEFDILLAFGAVSGDKNPAKGANLLIEALKILPELLCVDYLKRIKLVTFGGKAGRKDYDLPFICTELGHIKEQSQLAAIYSISDCVIVPSYVESFGQVAAEAQSCGVPVIAFDTSGLKDIVINGKTGFLAKPFCTLSLAKKISQVLMLSADEVVDLSANARQHIVDNFSYEIIASKYIDIIDDISNRK